MWRKCASLANIQISAEFWRKFPLNFNPKYKSPGIIKLSLHLPELYVSNTHNSMKSWPSSPLLAAKMADPEWLGGFTPSLHHHWFGFPSTSPTPPLPDLLWYLPSSPVATPGSQSPTCLGVAVWISMLDVVEYEEDRVREEGRANSKEGERTKAERREQSTSTAAVFLLFFFRPAFSSIIRPTHKHRHTTSALAQSML